MFGMGRAEEEWQVIRELLMQVFERSPDGILVVDAEGTIFLANRQAAVMFGWEISELIGRPVEMLVPQESRVRHAALRGGYGAHPETRPMGEGRILHGIRKDQAKFPVEISLSPIPDYRDVNWLANFTIAIIRDTSTRVQHGLRTPFAEIAGLAEDLTAKVAEAHRGQVEAILGSAKRGLEMTRESGGPAEEEEETG
jgi:PAS domain S-box-containing protein